MKGYIEITKSGDRYSLCNCCESKDERYPTYDVRFVYGISTTVIKLCEEHLREMRNQADKALD